MLPGDYSRAMADAYACDDGVKSADRGAFLAQKIVNLDLLMDAVKVISYRAQSVKESKSVFELLRFSRAFAAARTSWALITVVESRSLSAD